MTTDERHEYHSETELADLNAKIANDLEKLGLKQTDVESTIKNDNNEDSKYHIITFESRAGHRYQLYTIAEIYPSILSFEYNLARQVGRGLDEATIADLLTDLPEEFPLDVDEKKTESAGLIALSNMGDTELEELNYRIIDEVNTDRVDFETRMYEEVIHSVRIMGALFPKEDSHTIQHTEEIQIAIQSTGIRLNQFIMYAFSGLDGKDTEDITSEGPLF
jgi:hypothetical protein